uniref:Peptidase S9 prolyl oligopeptidase catalytic domain-containing protein n=1 Tax=Aegilops tauschii TaxID=37682 RepID=N1QRZ9_AEGTA
MAAAAAAGDLRSEYLEVLLSRRRERQVPMAVEQGSPVKEPLYQGNGPLGLREAMESCPRKEVDNFQEKLVEENFYLMTESGEQGRLPVLLLKLNDTAPERKPVVVILHSSYKCKEWLRPLLEAYASRGYIAVAIDSRYHGERASSKTTYIESSCTGAITTLSGLALQLNSGFILLVWFSPYDCLLLYDLVWDLIKLGDYLSAREDVDPSRIGITGESLGGMHAWFAAFVDTRYSVVVPIIGVQGFQWAIDNDKWQARVDSIKPLFEEARIDSGKSEIDAEVVKKVWDKIAPGMASQFDAPYSVPLIAPRPLLLLNGADDPRCPVLGLQEPASKATEAYAEAGSADKFKFSHCKRQPVSKPGCRNFTVPWPQKGATYQNWWGDRMLKFFTNAVTRNHYPSMRSRIRARYYPEKQSAAFGIANGIFYLLLHVQFIAEPGVGHRMTASMVKEASDWFDRFL